MTPSPIRRVLSVLNSRRVQHLLMGGQACVLYGAAEFSRDTDILLLLEESNVRRLEVADAHPARLAAAASRRPLLARIGAADGELILAALGEEERAERAADRAYWAPLRAELERLRHTDAGE